jgi:hypothetical protein
MFKCIVYLTKFLIVVLTALLFTSCKTNLDFGNGEKGNGNITTQTRTATDKFTAVEVHQGIEVEVTQADNQSISVTTDENLQKLIETKVKNGVLYISASDSYNTKASPLVKVSLQTIQGLTAESGASLKSKTLLICKTLNVKSSSGSSVNIDTETENLSLDSSSGSTIKGSGKALRLETVSSSGSSVNAEQLAANEVFSQASSGSTTNVAPIVSLDAKASSGSSINYKNTPKTIKKEESSGGSVSKD